MAKWKIIGIMTGNSMDAIDMVLTEFEGESFRDVCGFSKPYTQKERDKINVLRKRVVLQKIKAKDLQKDAEFLAVHDQYVKGIALAVNEFCVQNNIEKHSVNAIGFHGKTLDHNPPSSASKTGYYPFTTQMGSAQMLADLTGIPVINDFRSALIMNGLEGAPLAAPHNAHIAQKEGDGCYINAGNTSNVAWIVAEKALQSWDVGPFNEYTDAFVRRYKNADMDKNGKWGLKGKVLPELWSEIFELCHDFYELTPPKSGDPAFYKTEKLFAEVEKKYGNPLQNETIFCDILHTLEFFAGYLVAYAVASTPPEYLTNPHFVLFGGGWLNPVARQSFEGFILQKLSPLSQHKEKFQKFYNRLSCVPKIKYSSWGKYMESRLFADLARYYLENKTWDLPELITSKKHIVLGNMRFPQAAPVDDFLSKAAYGWQN